MSTNPCAASPSDTLTFARIFAGSDTLPASWIWFPFRTHLMVADAVTKSLPGPVLKLNRHVMLGHMLAYARVPYVFLRSAASFRHCPSMIGSFTPPISSRVHYFQVDTPPSKYGEWLVARIIRITWIHIFYYIWKKKYGSSSDRHFLCRFLFLLSHMHLAYDEDLFPPCLYAILTYKQRREEIFALSILWADWRL